ncbi:unnamed protein product [Prorocentrum cordatum]|uniref:F5/8 type C domain-containing protein n=1 Tax=Prorocentrum cordatum TaxID=2364126 RepID=A0ABN9SQI2_9DINO|nr:unnamed protein product [Polarella glacialis]
MVVKVVLACFVLASAVSALVRQGGHKLDSNIDAIANESHLGNNWLPMSCLRVAGIGSYYGEPLHRYENGACNNNYVFHPENMIYNCPHASYGNGWVGPDCKLNNHVTTNSLGNSGGCGGTDKTDAEWLAFDLGYTRYIESVKLKPSLTTIGSYYACPTYKILTSNSAPASGIFVAQASVGYTTVVDQSTAVDTSQEQTHSIGVSARYIMFDCVTSTYHSGGLDNFDVKADGDATPCDTSAPIPTPPPTPPPTTSPTPSPTILQAAAVYGYEVTYKSTHQIDDIYFVKNGARTIPFMESFPTYGGCTLTQGGPCNGGHQSPWDSSGKADNSRCWSFTTHSILCDHDITSDEVHIEFWSGGYSSTSGFTVKSLDAGGSVIATVADVGSRTGLTACNALDGAGTPTTCPVSPPTTYTQPTAATPSPTAATPSPPASGASAVGDPHLQNVRGERFDLMTEGKHVLISIPRGRNAENALLRVQADARRLGGQCADLYFQTLNVTGSWAEAKQAGGYLRDANRRRDSRMGCFW